MNEFERIEAIGDLFEKYAKYVSPNCFDLSPPSAWLPIIEEVFEFCEYNNSYPIQVVQVKEKFGSLRMYFDVDPERYDPALDNEIFRILNKSTEVCIVCGSPATHQTSGWLTYVCTEHMERKVNQTNIDWSALSKADREMKLRVKKAIPT